MSSAMNGVVFHTSTSTTAHIAICGLAVQATGVEMMCRFISMSLMMPNWSCSIQPQMRAETMVGMAHGTRMAVRTSARPGNSAFSTSAITMPRQVSMMSETTVNHTVFHTARHQSGSASTPPQEA